MKEGVGNYKLRKEEMKKGTKKNIFVSEYDPDQLECCLSVIDKKCTDTHKMCCNKLA